MRMKMRLIIILFSLFVASAAASIEPGNIVGNKANYFYQHKEEVYKWKCVDYSNFNQKITCEFLKAYVSHRDRHFDTAKYHVNEFLTPICIERNKSFPFNKSKNGYQTYLKFLTDKVKSMEVPSSGVTGNIDAELMLVNMVVAQKSLVDKAAFMAVVIDDFYKGGNVSHINYMYSSLYEVLVESFLLSKKTGLPIDEEVSLLYKSVFQKMTPHNLTTKRYREYITNLWAKIPRELRDNEADEIIAAYIKSQKNELPSDNNYRVIDSLQRSSNNYFDIAIRLHFIQIYDLISNLPEEKVDPNKNGMNKVRIRYYGILDKKDKRRMKSFIVDMVDLVFTKNTSFTKIDELAVAYYIIHRDEMNLPRRKEGYYKTLEEKYSILMTDYLDFSDSMSKGVKAINTLGHLSSRPVFSEGIL